MWNPWTTETPPLTSGRRCSKGGPQLPRIQESGSPVGSNRARTQVLPRIQQEQNKTFTRAQDGENLEEQLISDPEFEAHSTAGSAQRRAKNSEKLLATTSRSLTSASSSKRAGRVKKRLILDLEKSGVSRRTRKTHRPSLPAPRRDQGHPGTLVCEGHTVQCLLLDFTDTFWQIPLARAERKNIVGFDGKSLWMYSRSAQGSNGPLTWAGPSSR